MKTLLRIGFSALAIAAIALGRDTRTKQESNEQPAAVSKSSSQDEKKDAKREMRAVRLGASSDEGTLVGRHFKTLLLPGIKSGRCGSVSTGVAIQQGDKATLYVDESRENMVWALQEEPDGTLAVRVCNQDKQDTSAEPWAVMLFIRR